MCGTILRHCHLFSAFHWVSGSFITSCPDPNHSISIQRLKFSMPFLLQVVAFRRRQKTRHRHGKHSDSHDHHIDREGSCKYYGVILQSKKRRDAGCYVLKTMDSSVGDCTCIHWTLTRMRHGKAIFDQLSSAWLANA